MDALLIASPVALVTLSVSPSSIVWPARCPTPAASSRFHSPKVKLSVAAPSTTPPTPRGVPVRDRRAGPHSSGEGATDSPSGGWSPIHSKRRQTVREAQSPAKLGRSSGSPIGANCQVCRWRKVWLA